MKKLNNIYLNLRYRLPLHFILLITNWLPDNVIFLRIRGWLASWFFLKCGSNLLLGRNLVFYNPDKILLGENNYIAYGNYFIAGVGIEIGDSNIFGPSSIFVDGNHVFDGCTYYNEMSDSKKLIIGSNCWIGAQCKILRGSVIENHVLIAAGAVLSKQTEPFGVYGGVPAKKILNSK